MGFDMLNIIWLVIGGVISFFIFIIKNSYSAGKTAKSLITKDEVDTKLDLLKSEFDKKFEEIDNKIEKKFDDINTKLNSMNEILIKQDARESEKAKYEKDVKESGKASLERICLMLVEFNKKIDTQQNLIIKHESILNDRRRTTDSFTE